MPSWHRDHHRRFAAAASAWHDGGVTTRAELLASRAVLRTRVRRGDARAALALARSLDRTPPRDHAAARRAYEVAAAASIADAMNALGEMLQDGRGGRRDAAAAARWFEAAARSGHDAAAANLAAALFHGDGAKRDRPAAARLWRRAARAGIASAMFDLGACLRDGEGVARDPGAALRWFRRAAARGHAGAASVVGRAYWWGRLGAPRDRARAAPFLLAAARCGDERAEALLAVILRDVTRPKDAVAARRLLRAVRGGRGAARRKIAPRTRAPRPGKLNRVGHGSRGPG
jgi:TPR repeat protein